MTAPTWLPRYARTVTRRRFLQGSVAGASGAFLLACGGDDDGGDLAAGVKRNPGAVLYDRDYHLWPEESSNAVPGGTYADSEGVDNEQGYDIFWGSALVTAPETYEFLIRRNRAPGVAVGSLEYNTPQPGLASSYEVSQDGLAVTFKLRPGVKFHRKAPVNGREMNIDDWRTSVQRFEAMHPHATEWLELRDKVEFPDTRTMVVRLKEPYAPFVIRSTEGTIGFSPAIMPRELHEKVELAATVAAGTNFRELVDHQPSRYLAYERFDDYWDGKPFIDRWVEYNIPEPANKSAQFLTQNIISFIPTMREVLQIRTSAPEAMIIADQISTTDMQRFIYGRQEANTAPWKDARVRIALHRAMNWDGLLGLRSNRDEFRSRGIEVEADFATHVPFDPLFWLDPRKNELGPQSENYLYNVAEAKKLVTAAGYPNGIEMIINSRNTTFQGSDDWTVYKSEMENSGVVRFELREYRTSTDYLNNVVRSNNFKGMSFLQSGGGDTDADYHLTRQFHSRGTATAYSSPEMDRLIEAQRRERDILKRAEVIKDIQKLAATQWPVGPGSHRHAPFRLEWPWLRNASYPQVSWGHKRWLDPAMPRRDRRA